MNKAKAREALQNAIIVAEEDEFCHDGKSLKYPM